MKQEAVGRRRKRDGGERHAPQETAPVGGPYQDLLVAGALLLLTVVFFWGFVFSDRMLFGTDTIPTGYMARKVYSEFLRSEGALPLWNPYILGGLPFIDALHGDALYPTTLLNLFMPVHRFIGAKLVLHVFLAGLCMYGFLRARTLGRWAALLGGVGYMFAPYLVSLIYAGHDGKLYVTALLPLAFCCLEMGLRTPRVFYSVMLGGCVGLLFLTSHVQMTAYALWGLGLYLLFHGGGLVRREGSFRPCVRPLFLFVLAVAIGFAVGLVQFLPSYLYTKTFSPRAGGVAYEYATTWSLHPEEIVSLAVPQFVHYLGDYWGRNPFKLNCEAPGLIVLVLAGVALSVGWSRRTSAVFFGALVLFFLSLVTASVLQAVLIVLTLGGFVLCILKGEDLAFFVLISVFALFYSVGAHTPVYKFFFHAIPGVKFFRAPSTIMMLFLFSTAAMAATGADRLVARAGSPEPRRIARRLAWVVLAGLALWVFLAVGRDWVVGFWGRSIYPELGSRRALMEANYPRFLRGLALSLALVGGVAFCAWILGDRRVRPWWALAGLGALLIGSTWPVDRDFVRYIRVEDVVRRDPITHRMAEDGGLFRVLPLTGSQLYDRNYLPIFGLQTLSGFHDNRLRIFDEITAEGRLLHPRILDLYNTKYVVTRTPIEAPSFEELLVSGENHLYLNRGVLPRAFVAYNFEVIADSAAVIRRLVDPDFDYRSTLILSRTPEGVQADSTRAPVPVEMLAYGPNQIRIRTTSEAAGLLFVGDNYFPYWRASVDGGPVPILRCDYAFRAVPVGAGTHEVVLRYRSDPLLAGGVVSGVAAAVVLGWLIVRLVSRFSQGRGRRE